MPAFKTRINQALESRKAQGLTRVLKPLEHSNQAILVDEGKSYVNFSSNDYLGLASDKELVSAWQQGLDIYGVGSGASPLVSGFSRAHQNLEASLCEWLGFERAILFNSGFSANQALIFSLLEKQDTLVQDKLNHASLMEAGINSPASMKRFKHNDAQHLAKILSNSSDALVVTEGVFSMDGDKAPLSNIAEQCQIHDAWLVVDDAHGIGVLGEDGAGSCGQAAVKPDLLIVTFGKAFGLSGAAILCSSEVGDYLTQFARHHVYSTAMPPSQAHALTHACQMIQTQQWRRDKLAELQLAYQASLCDLKGYVDTQTPIKPFVCGESHIALALAEKLKQQQLWTTAIRPPTVPNGSARLRITLTANHSLEQVNRLGKVIRQAVESDIGNR
ncbi:8-amino-7-oxononanoate synthase [Vibrio sp. T187]|uniref:8-amino-7-oxononanoate synthase n=1 Tax=Vibrio TaxID=662 RepID=UPI0010C9A3B2|nr:MULTISPECIES: 8-amino-7-oxononanoate synthase [Vibrio]MBW3694635.1 8-amino-7-oxononanoate synthase [Vibrio sp. T187]